MILAIHDGKSWNLSWREYCKLERIHFLEVNCYDVDIIDQLKNEKVTHLMWHFHHSLPKDILMARNVLYSAAKMGIKTFPDFNTSWHFDDKVSQKYLLEAVGAPLVKSYTFYDEKTALQWLSSNARYPIVAKLRRGAGSYNVKLIYDYLEAKKYTKVMFTNGVNPAPGYIADVKNKLKVAGSMSKIIKRLKKAPNYFKMVSVGRKFFPKEQGYVYFQEFIPNNECDYRIKVVGDICWGFRRFVRDNDFRASGSGMLSFDLTEIPISMIKIAFEITQKLKMQSVAFDFILNENREPLIVEVSYGFGIDEEESDGYWNRDLERVNKRFTPENIILDNFIR